MLAAVVCAGAEDKGGSFGDKIFMRLTEGAAVSVCKRLTLMPVYLPYSAARLKKMPERLAAYILGKTVSEYSEGGTEIVFSSQLRGIVRENARLSRTFGGYICSDKGYMHTFMPDILRKIAPRCGIDPMRARVCISERKAGRISEYLMRELCFDVKRLTLCTEDLPAAEKMCADFAEETGFFPNIADFGSVGRRGADILLDADGCCVRIGRDLTVDGVELRLGGLAAAVENADVLRFVGRSDIRGLAAAYLSGKNRLTLDGN